MKSIRFIDMFGGIGGFRLGLEKASRKFECVAYYDICEPALKVYNSKFGERHEAEDVTKIKEADVPRHDLVCGGFPCQAFSHAGKRLGFADTRGTLFHEICRIVEHRGSKFLLLENVKGLLDHDDGRTFAVILSKLDELGYDAEWQVLDSKDFGVAQTRQRVYIFAHLRGVPAPKIFPFGEETPDSDCLGKGLCEAFPTLKASYSGIMDDAVILEGDFNGKVGNNAKDRLEEYEIRKILLHGYGFAGAEIQKALGEISRRRRDSRKENPDFSGQLLLASLPFAREDAENERGVLGEKTFEERRKGFGNDGKGGSGGLESREDLGARFGQLRLLTPVECERLQGFPDGWTEGLPDRQRWKCLGNAVTVGIVEAIGRKFVNEL